MSLQHLVVPTAVSKEVLKLFLNKEKGCGMSKGHKSQHKRAAIGKGWHDLSKANSKMYFIITQSIK